MKIKNVDFYTSFASAKAIPEHNKIEVAFLGRSNVGKSSLLNDLCRARIAKTSSTPGKTQLINYFLINDKFYFVDLPGYGYAKVSKSMKRNWGQIIEEYLSNSPNLRVLFFLLDIRREPNDHDMLINEWIKKLPNIRAYYILTKADKFSRSKGMSQKAMIAKKLFVSQHELIMYSVTKKEGREDLLKNLGNSIKLIEEADNL